jgi:hypothetical protein
MNPALRQLKDIKPPVEVPDDSLWFLIAIAAAVLLLFSALWYVRRLKRRARRRRRRVDPAVQAKKRLKAIDFSDTKGAVYTFGEAMPLLIGENDELMRRFDALLRELEKYKYKKVVPPLQSGDVKKMKALMKEVL